MPRSCTRSNPFLLYSSYCHRSIRSSPVLLVACPSRISSASCRFRPRACIIPSICALVVLATVLIFHHRGSSSALMLTCVLAMSLTLPCCPNWSSGGHGVAPSDHWVLGLKTHLHVKCEGFRAGLRALIHGKLL
ncbi:hypothetical protein ZIOFF_043443 [Zingiber officinale]|uniref:Uncharacterized protein n=1 Tax=Zingiber officinale TaxID=94328 RepID=A0A8J5GAL9_ZINOF|nr:hypothetical protein ZIOFF_043443 [Zingiber officinale]